MKKYMIVCQNTDDNKTEASFADTYNEARNIMMNAECGMGWPAEIYARVEIDEDGYKGSEYRLLEA